MKYCILSGSARHNSNTLRVSKGLARVLQEMGASDIELISFENYDIPNFNQPDPQPDSLTPFQSQLVQAMRGAHSIIFVTPEYNWFPTAEIIQFIHRFGDTPFADIWNEKVFSFVGISSGRGGRIPTVQLGYVVGKLINVFGFQSMVNSKSFEVQFVTKVLGPEGESLDNPEFDKGLNKFTSHLIQVSKRWHGLASGTSI